MGGMSAEQPRQPGGRPTGGRYAPTTHAEPEVAVAGPLDRFPHPDRRYPHPMEAWPAGVELPATVSLGSEDLDTTPGWVNDPQLETCGEFPTAVVSMPNGATLIFQELPGDEVDVRWVGDWDAYTPEGSDAREDISDVALEYAAQSRR